MKSGSFSPTGKASLIYPAWRTFHQKKQIPRGVIGRWKVSSWLRDQGQACFQPNALRHGLILGQIQGRQKKKSILDERPFRGPRKSLPPIEVFLRPPVKVWLFKKWANRQNGRKNAPGFPPEISFQHFRFRRFRVLIDRGVFFRPPHEKQQLYTPRRRGHFCGLTCIIQFGRVTLDVIIGMSVT